jgi:integrase
MKMGIIYKKKGSPFLYYAFYQGKKQIHRSSHSTSERDARRLLREAEGDVARGRIPSVNFDKVLFDDLCESFLTDYRINRKRSIDKAERSVRYLKDSFGGMRANHINTDMVQKYIEKRQEAMLSNATINRELAALKRIFHLGTRCTPPKVPQIPYIPMLKESNIRKGFFEEIEFRRLLTVLPEYLRPVALFAYEIGWRKEEILKLKWDRIDLVRGCVRLEPGESKGGEGRTVYLSMELKNELIKLWVSHKSEFVFTYRGKPIKDFKESWVVATEKVGLKGKLFHDFRRTAIRNMVRQGTPERVAMEISGHKTRSVFDRYDIVSEKDLKEVANRIDNSKVIAIPQNPPIPTENKVLVTA